MGAQFSTQDCTNLFQRFFISTINRQKKIFLKNLIKNISQKLGLESRRLNKFNAVAAVFETSGQEHR